MEGTSSHSLVTLSSLVAIKIKPEISGLLYNIMGIQRPHEQSLLDRCQGLTGR